MPEPPITNSCRPGLTGLRSIEMKGAKKQDTNKFQAPDFKRCDGGYVVRFYQSVWPSASPPSPSWPLPSWPSPSIVPSASSPSVSAAAPTAAPEASLAAAGATASKAGPGAAGSSPAPHPVMDRIKTKTPSKARLSRVFDRMTSSLSVNRSGHLLSIWFAR